MPSPTEPQPDPRFGGFWDNLSVDELACRQGVSPVTDLDALAGDWPEADSFEDFLSFLREIRGHSPTTKAGSDGADGPGESGSESPVVEG